MVEAASASETSVTMAAPNALATQATNAAAGSSEGDREKSLEFAEDLMEKGSKAIKDNDFSEAAECFSRALQIRRVILNKTQLKTGYVKNAINGGSSIASVSGNVEEEAGTNHQEGAPDDATVSSGKDQEEEDEDSDVEDLAEADEDESDLDFSWKMLDVARAIVEKHSFDTMEKVDILYALAEVALERDDIKSSLSDYQKALSLLERLVEPDSRLIAELNFRICLCLEIDSKPQEAIPFCQKAISVCKSRVQRLMNEVKSVSESSTSSSASELDHCVNSCGELEKKLKDLHQQALNPKSILSELLGMASAKSLGSEKSASPTVMSSSRMELRHSSASELDQCVNFSDELEKKLKDLHQLALNPKSILSELLGIASAKLLSSEKGASPTVLSSSRMELTHSSASELDQCVNSSGELEKKLKDLHKLALNPKSILSELLGMASAKSLGSEKSASPTVTSSLRMATADSSGDFDSPTITTAHTNGSSGVTHLGMVGRGLKRVLTNSGTAESSPMKKQH